MFIKFAMVQRSRKHLHVAMVKVYSDKNFLVLSHFRFSDTEHDWRTLRTLVKSLSYTILQSARRYYAYSFYICTFRYNSQGVAPVSDPRLKTNRIE